MTFSDCPCSGGTLDKLVQPALLAALTEGPVHGYRLAERINEMTGQCGEKPDVSGIYRFLKKMEAAGLVTSEWETGRQGTRQTALRDHGRWPGLFGPLDYHLGSLPGSDHRSPVGGSGL